MVTMRHVQIGLVVLLLVVLLMVMFAVYWQHMTGMNTMHLLAANMNPFPTGPVGEGC